MANIKTIFSKTVGLYNAKADSSDDAAVTINGNLTVVAGTASLTGPVSLSGSIDTKGQLVVSGNLFVTGSAFVATNVTASNNGNCFLTGTLDVLGVTVHNAGTVTAPGITTHGDTDTGLFFPAANRMAATVGKFQIATFISGATAATSLTTVTGGLQVSGVVSVPQGTVSAPSLAVIDDTDTGFWSPAANQMAATVGGAQIFVLASGSTAAVNTVTVTGSFLHTGSTVGFLGVTGSTRYPWSTTYGTTLAALSGVLAILVGLGFLSGSDTGI